METLFPHFSRAGAGLALAAALFFAPAAPASAQADPATVVVTVNGQPITAADLTAAYAAFADQFSQVPPEQRDAAVVDFAINVRLASQAAEAAGLDKDPNVMRRLEVVHDGTLYREYLRSKFVTAVTEQAVRARFDEEMADFVPGEEIHARHILVGLDQEDLAKQIIAELDAGGDFAEIAGKHSQDPGSGQSGGDLGWFGRGQMVKPFEDAAFALAPGEYTKTPVRSDFGWHVILVEERRPQAPPTFEQEAPRIEQQLIRETFDREIGALRAAAKIEFAAPPGTPEPAQ